MKVVCFDLDDTISKEICYLQSAYMDIASYATASCKASSIPEDELVQKAYERMLEAYQKGENAFEVLNSFLGVSNPMSEYLQIYRNHRPNIVLTDEVFETLSKLRKLRDENLGKKVVLGLITDGRSVQQRSKINALGLEQFFDVENIVISEEFGSEKPSSANYEYFMKRYTGAEFTYMGDNPQKDFVGANALGWNTICLLDDGRNIHKQEFEKYGEEYQPKHKIALFSEMLKFY